MNIIKTSSYEGDYNCPICLCEFAENDQLCLVKHIGEKISQARKHKHMYHHHCIQAHINNCDSEWVPNCPLDRQPIAKLVRIKYSELVALNIINYADNYYQLLRKLCQVSFVDHINLNYKDSNGKTLLYCACQRGDTKLVKKLLKMGAHPSIADDSGFTPLMASVTNGHLDVVKILLRYPTVVNEVNHTDQKGLNAIEYAIKYEQHDAVLLLLSLTNIERSVISFAYRHYQLMKSTNLTIHEVKNRLRILMGLPKLTHKIISQPVPHRSGSTVTRHHEHKSLDIDENRHSRLYQMIYAPDRRISSAVPSSSTPVSLSEEIERAMSFTEDELNNLSEYCLD